MATSEVSTGLGALEEAEAERRLAEYIAKKHQPTRDREQSPSSIPVADVLAVYVTDRTATVGRPIELRQRVTALADFFGTMMLSDINGAACRAYTAQRGSSAMARRELEDLRAAINHHRREGYCNAVVDVVLPPKPQPRERWLTRSEAARLIWAAWRYREVQKEVVTARKSRQHVARFILVGLYTGTRSAAICGAALQRTPGKGFVDLDAGVFYRKALGVAETNKRQPTVRFRLDSSLTCAAGAPRASARAPWSSSTGSRLRRSRRRSLAWRKSPDLTIAVATRPAPYGYHMGDAERRGPLRGE